MKGKRIEWFSFGDARKLRLGRLGSGAAGEQLRHGRSLIQCAVDQGAERFDRVRNVDTSAWTARESATMA